MRLLILLTLLICSLPLYSQNIKTNTLRWNVHSIQEISPASFKEVEESITSVGTTTVTWNDVRGEARRTFTIVEVNGSWSNVSHTGSVVYEVSESGRRGTITFSRTGSNIKISILMMSDGDLPEAYEMTVNTIEAV